MGKEGLAILRYPVRGRVICKYLGQLGLMLALLTTLPLTVSLWWGEYAISQSYLFSILILLLLGLPLSRLSVPSSIQTNEALTITALAFFISPLFMTHPFMAAGVPFPDALFETISGITTTGLSMLPSVEHQSPSLLFARAWMQWYGGLGIAILSVALLMGQNIVAKRLVEPVPGENLVTTTRTHARQVLTAYAVLTILGIVCLLSLQVDPFHAITLTLAAISTGGFAPFNDSLAGLHSPSAATCLLIVSLGGSLSLPSMPLPIITGFAACFPTWKCPLFWLSAYWPRRPSPFR